MSLDVDGELGTDRGPTEVIEAVPSRNDDDDSCADTPLSMSLDARLSAESDRSRRGGSVDVVGGGSSRRNAARSREDECVTDAERAVRTLLGDLGGLGGDRARLSSSGIAPIFPPPLSSRKNAARSRVLAPPPDAACARNVCRGDECVDAIDGERRNAVGEGGPSGPSRMKSARCRSDVVSDSTVGERATGDRLGNGGIGGSMSSITQSLSSGSAG